MSRNKSINSNVKRSKRGKYSFKIKFKNQNFKDSFHVDVLRCCSSRRSLAAWYARPASAARVSIQVFNGSCLTSKARKPATIPPKNETGSAAKAEMIPPNNASLDGLFSFPPPLEAAHTHLLGNFCVFMLRLGRLERATFENVGEVIANIFS